MVRYKIMDDRGVVFDREIGISWILGTNVVCDEHYKEWLADGNTPDPADPPPPPPVVYKEKNSIIMQIVQAGKYDLAETELAKLPNWQQALWNGAYKIAYDDQLVRQMLADINMDAETVMSSATTFGN